MKTTGQTYIVRTFGDASQLDPLMYGIGISVFELDEVEFFETEGNQSTSRLQQLTHLPLTSSKLWS